jgi:hypothetical protein
MNVVLAHVNNLPARTGIVIVSILVASSFGS